MAGHGIPTTVDDVTADWLTASLRDAGALGDGTVASFSSELIGQGVGLLGILHRLRPNYDGKPGRETAVLKTPVGHEMTRFVARTFQFYSKEVEFYRTAATLSGAILRGTSLIDADLSLADLVGADLTGAQMDGVSLDGIRHAETTTWPEGFHPPSSGNLDDHD